VRRLAGGGRHPDEAKWSAKSRCIARSDDRLTALADAWSAAAGSGANSPGRRIAYYSLDVDGLHLTGERPWVLRWDAISRCVDFRGKHLVELGCNMGLLSIHARLNGASGAVGVDISEGVIRAAAMAAEAFGVEMRVIRADFDCDEDWEDRVGGGDIVSALSLTYWLRDKDRLWRYLSRFSEVIFEGHEPDSETRDRFSGLGYTEIVEVGLSERNRMVYFARRSEMNLTG
jgi:SAM-dependent methyltransferase